MVSALGLSPGRGHCVVFLGMTLKVAEHSFQEPIPNSPLLLRYLSFGARFLQESRLTTEEFILAFWLRCELLP